MQQQCRGGRQPRAAADARHPRGPARCHHSRGVDAAWPAAGLRALLHPRGAHQRLHPLHGGGGPHDAAGGASWRAADLSGDRQDTLLHADSWHCPRHHPWHLRPAELHVRRPDHAVAGLCRLSSAWHWGVLCADRARPDLGEHCRAGLRPEHPRRHGLFGAATAPDPESPVPGLDRHPPAVADPAHLHQPAPALSSSSRGGERRGECFMSWRLNTDLAAGLFGLLFATVFWWSRGGLSPLSSIFPEAVLTVMTVVSVALVIKGFVRADVRRVYDEGNRVRLLVTTLILFAWWWLIGL